MAKYFQKGEAIDYKNTTEALIKAGDIVAIGEHVGIAGTDIAPAGMGTLHTVGVFVVEKTNVADVFELGDDVFFDGSGAVAENGTLMGWAIEASPASLTTVKVKIG